VRRSVAVNTKTGFALDVLRGPLICGAVGGDRSGLAAHAAFTEPRRARADTTVTAINRPERWEKRTGKFWSLRHRSDDPSKRNLRVQ
jgi:hypothetical protein